MSAFVKTAVGVETIDTWKLKRHTASSRLPSE
jgi:hypothetical protein